MRKVVSGARLAMLAGNRTVRLVSTAVAALGLYVCLQTANRAAEQANAPHDPTEDYGEFLARPEDLANVSVNRIVRSLRLHGTAMKLGRAVYDQHCALCHGADLKGLPDRHTPDLTDSEWRFSGDDFETGGLKKFPSDVEWTVRYGIRSGHENARGAEVNMLAYDPKYRTKEDTEDFGDAKFMTDEEIDDVVEYVLQLGGQPADKAKAARGNSLFQNNAKGNCFDCHGEEGAGIDTFGSTNLTRRDLYLYGSDRASILESIVKGRHGQMPAFEDQLKPEELKAVSVFVFSRAATK
ncbi:MAG: cytochrome c oxidase cbb3-type subunit [Alphaproteobacteria bacterium]|jgi:cytochrome c oxidase cbb3-type subunit 3|nr:cytochrome c oxidase cbb3-type subunit [Alphaproteobacteria bacterium]